MPERGVGKICKKGIEVLDREFEKLEVTFSGNDVESPHWLGS